jgi:hypothetical protein
LLPADLEQPDQPDKLIQEARHAVGPLTGLVLCHCESVDSGILDTTVSSFDRHYAVNVRASWQLIVAFARQLTGHGGRVVALTSADTIGNLPYGPRRALWTASCSQPPMSSPTVDCSPTSSTPAPPTPAQLRGPAPVHPRDRRTDAAGWSRGRPGSLIPAIYPVPARRRAAKVEPVGSTEPATH